jgi:F-type H+-transporting ATPase subunit epsilon
VRTFTLHLQGATRAERFDGVQSFVGRDRSGQFGIRAHHERLMTVLGLGLARFRQADAPWQYLGLAGGLLHFVGNELFVCTPRYIRDEREDRLTQALDEELRREQALQEEFRHSLRRLEQEMLRRLWRMPGEEAL